MSSTYSDHQQQEDEAHLSRMGYAQQLLREMGGFSNFALSFSIISILTGAVTLYGHGLTYGGPLVMTLGWPFVTLMTLAVAASLAELASAFPTAGALYHWSAVLGSTLFGSTGYGFITAWLNTLGQFAITAAIDYGLASFVVPMLGWPDDRPHLIAVYGVILLSHAILNHRGVRVVALLNRISAWYHIVGVAILIGALAWRAPLQDISFLLTRHSATGHGYLYSFCVGLLQAAWTFTGYDASAHATEETHDPSRNAPWGIFLSVAVSGVVGYAMLLVVTLAIPQFESTVTASYPFIDILTHTLGYTGRIIIWLILGAMWFCGLSSVTANSRMLFAFARDGGLPASKLLCRVSLRFQTPHISIWVCCIAAFLLALGTTVYSAMAALSTIALYASYGIPIALGLLAQRRGVWRKKGPWHLGKASLPINLVALGWIATISVLFVLPPNELAGKTFGGCLVCLVVYWRVWMRARFTGPAVTSL